MDTWTASVGITHGPIFRAINKTGRVLGRRHVSESSGTRSARWPLAGIDTSNRTIEMNSSRLPAGSRPTKV